jgi:hypothetical protein
MGVPAPKEKAKPAGTAQNQLFWAPSSLQAEKNAPQPASPMIARPTG